MRIEVIISWKRKEGKNIEFRMQNTEGKDFEIAAAYIASPLRQAQGRLTGEG
jgi:hypothetical protein